MLSFVIPFHDNVLIKPSILLQIHLRVLQCRHGVNSGIGIAHQFQFWNWNCLFKKMELELINLDLEFNPQKV